jgi:isopentenyl-diphosphate delta-isomerase
MGQSQHGQDVFSCYVFTSDARLLLTMRGQAKESWPGVWANSCHGTAAPGESLSDAVARALRDELGFTTAVADLVLPATYRVVTDEAPHPDPAQVGDFEWVAWTDFVYGLAAGDLTVAPWCAPQVAALSALGADPLRWPVADVAVPPAA